MTLVFAVIKYNNQTCPMECCLTDYCRIICSENRHTVGVKSLFWCEYLVHSEFHVWMFFLLDYVPCISCGTSVWLGWVLQSICYTVFTLHCKSGSTVGYLSDLFLTDSRFHWSVQVVHQYRAFLTSICTTQKQLYWTGSIYHTRIMCLIVVY